METTLRSKLDALSAKHSRIVVRIIDSWLEESGGEEIDIAALGAFLEVTEAGARDMVASRLRARALKRIK